MTAAALAAWCGAFAAPAHAASHELELLPVQL